MEYKKFRKSLGLRTSEEFYNEVVEYAKAHYMSITTLIKRALYETYGLKEEDWGMPSKDK